jgi:hypothetical protein
MRCSTGGFCSRVVELHDLPRTVAAGRNWYGSRFNATEAPLFRNKT